MLFIHTLVPLGSGLPFASTVQATVIAGPATSCKKACAAAACAPKATCVANAVSVGCAAACAAC